MYIWILFILTQALPVFSFVCKEPENVNTFYVNVNDTPPHNYRSKRATKLRIKMDYSNNLKVESDFYKIKARIVEPAVRFWENTLVAKKPIVNKVLFPRSCPDNSYYVINNKEYCPDSCSFTTRCSKGTVPPQYLDACYSVDEQNRQTKSGNEGYGLQDFDILIVMDRIHDGCIGDVAAYASHCGLSKTDSRPILGFVNLCPNKELTIGVVIHEIGHILAFSNILFEHFLDKNGKPLNKRAADGKLKLESKRSSSASYHAAVNSKTLLMVTKAYSLPGRTETRDIPYLMTEKVKNTVQQYFNCPSANGVKLDYKSVSHFDGKVLVNELMSPSLSKSPKISIFTLSLFEDSGWYKVNYKNADQLLLGQNAGCDFVEKSCFDYIKERKYRNADISPYCETLSNVLRCSPDKLSVQTCDLEYNPYTSQTSYRYFRNQSLVGSNSYREFCPLPHIERSCDDKKSEKLIGNDNPLGEYFGEGSKCIRTSGKIEFTISSSAYSSSQQGAGCYKVDCNKNTKSFSIVIFTKRFECKKEGQLVPFEEETEGRKYKGTYICPKYNDVCIKTKRKLLKNSTVKSNKMHVILLFLVVLTPVLRSYLFDMCG